MRAALFLLALSACDTVDSMPVEADSLPTDQAAVPATPTWWVSNLVLGETFTIEIWDANPNDTLYIGYSFDGPGNGPCPPVLGGFCIGMLNPQLLTTVTADASGYATFSIQVPASIPANEITFQAIAGYGRSAYATPATTRIVQADPPVPMTACRGGVSPASDPFVRNNAFINGDTLFVDVEYSGGCEVHTFDACYGLWMTSLPVQTDVTITHDANGDICRALILETVRFDLNPMRVSYPWTTPADIMLNLDGRTQLMYSIP